MRGRGKDRDFDEEGKSVKERAFHGTRGHSRREAELPRSTRKVQQGEEKGGGTGVGWERKWDVFN